MKLTLKLSKNKLWAVDAGSGLPLYEDDRGNLYKTNMSPLFPQGDIEVAGHVAQQTLLCIDEMGFGYMSDVRFLVDKTWGRP